VPSNELNPPGRGTATVKIQKIRIISNLFQKRSLDVKPFIGGHGTGIIASSPASSACN